MLFNLIIVLMDHCMLGKRADTSTKWD